MSRTIGTPNPKEWIVAQSVKTVGDPLFPRTLYEGVTFSSTAEKSAAFACAGASRLRVRFNASVAGTLAIIFMRPDGVTRYAAGNPATVAVTSGTETLIDTDAVYGESWCIVTFTPGSGSGACTLFDIMAL